MRCVGVCVYVCVCVCLIAQGEELGLDKFVVRDLLELPQHEGDVAVSQPPTKRADVQPAVCALC